jgi:hypothetical protein
MSKQSEAKERQGYTTNVRNCGNCARLEFDMKPPAWMQARADAGTYEQDIAARLAVSPSRKRPPASTGRAARPDPCAAPPASKPLPSCPCSQRGQYVGMRLGCGASLRERKA